MRVPPLSRPEIAEIMIYGVDKLTARGVSHRRAVRRIATKHGARRRSVTALIAHDDRLGGDRL